MHRRANISLSKKMANIYKVPLNTVSKDPKSWTTLRSLSQQEYMQTAERNRWALSLFLNCPRVRLESRMSIGNEFQIVVPMNGSCTDRIEQFLSAVYRGPRVMLNAIPAVRRATQQIYKTGSGRPVLSHGDSGTPSAQSCSLSAGELEASAARP